MPIVENLLPPLAPYSIATVNEPRPPTVKNGLLEALSAITSRFDTLEVNMDSRFNQTEASIKEIEPDILDAKAILGAIQVLMARLDTLEAHMNKRFDETNTLINDIANNLSPRGLVGNANTVPNPGNTHFYKLLKQLVRTHAQPTKKPTKFTKATMAQARPTNATLANSRGTTSTAFWFRRRP
ncbi:hypothetical protein H0H87_007778 [Tephrocybe sp. NHM501043]|nr:hypothetical protein H0H87_007778 [Tephrocybe sp. NHM501043]